MVERCVISISISVETLADEKEFPAYKRSLITQGRAFCAITAPQCREKIAALAVDFLVDDCTVSLDLSP